MRHTDLHHTGHEEQATPPRKPGGLLWLAVLLLAAVTVFLYLRTRGEVPESPPVLVPPADQAPLVRHPLPETGGEDGVAPAAASPLAQHLVTPLPGIDDSDAALAPLVSYLIDNPALAELLVPRDLIRRFVVTIDSLPGREVPQNRLPTSLPGGRFLAVERNGGTWIDERNYARYARHLELLKGIDGSQLTRAYVHFYPLFQDAYREMGNKGYFNDRLIAVIDHLLETPAVEQTPRLEQPSVLYVYADPGLENLSAGRKLLLRMGPEQAEAVKEKLREIRAALSQTETLN
jgi:hypothetical protein